MIQSFTCIFKIVFSYESEVGAARQGFEFVHSFSLSNVHIYLNLDTRQDGHFLHNFLSIWPLNRNNKLGKITQYDTRYIGSFGCD